MKRNPKKFERCVRAVKKRGGARNAYAVCSSLRANPGELEFDTSKAAQQYKRLVEAEGSTGVRISRRGRKHVVRWNGLLSFLGDFGRKTTVHRVKAGKTETSAGRHKGHGVYKRADGGFVVPSLDSSVFDSKREANRFIDSWTKNNPHKRRGRRDKFGRFLPGRNRPPVSARHLAKVNRGVRRNTVEAAREKYAEFHGRPSEDLIEIDTPVHVHDVLSGIGTLVKMVVLTPNGRWRVTLKGFKGTLVAQNEDSEKMPQLYLEGGDQGVDLADFGIVDPVHEFEELGRMEWIYYHTVKDHLGDDGGDAIYKHKLRRIRGGARGREKPVVIYDVRNKLIQIAGGAYSILPEGIEN